MYSVRLFLSAESSDHNSEVHCVQDMWGIPVLHLQPGPHTAAYLLLEKMDFEIEPDLLSLRKKVTSIPLVYGFWAISRRAVRLSLPLTLVTILVVYGFQGNPAIARRYEHPLSWRYNKTFFGRFVVGTLDYRSFRIYVYCIQAKTRSI